MSNVSNGTKWSLQEELLLYNLKKADKSYREIADVLQHVEGRREYSENCCKKKWNDTDWNIVMQNEEAHKAKIDQVLNDESNRKKVIESTLANQERLVRREKARTDLIIEAVQSAIYRLPKPGKINYTPSKKTKYTQEHVVVVLSDLHMGASYTFEDTGGLSEFNADICTNRLERLKNAVLKIVERHRLMYDIPHLHIFCLGDIVAGMNDAGAWSPNYIDMDIYDQMFAGVAAVRNVVAEWAKAFENVTFYGIYGNHGRIGKRGVQKAYSNWDKICYEFIRLSLQEYSNIEWKIPKSWFLQEKILGHSFYLTHGDGIKGSMGIPYYGVEKAERNILGLLDEKPEYFVIGHFHTPAELQTNSGRIIINGSFMGGDMYSLRDLRKADKAEQKMFGIHEEKGVTWAYNIQLDVEE